MEQNDLILMLKNELDEINLHLSLLSSKISFLNDYINICDNTININPTDIVGIELDEMFEDIEFYDLDIIQKLKIYQKLSSNDSYPINEEQKNEIKDLFKIIKNFLAEKNNNFLDEISKLKSRKLILEKVINKLNSNNIDIETYEFLYKYLIIDEKDLGDKLDLLIELSLNLSSSFNYESLESEEEVLEQVSTTNLDIERVREIFNKYGYNFNEISDEVSNSFSLKIDDVQVSPREYLLKLGNYENIEEILNVFRQNNIHLDFNKYSKQLSILFVLSNSSNIETVIYNIKEDLGIQLETNETLNETFDDIFKKFIKHPSLFIKGRKYWGELKTTDDDKNSSK